MSNDTWVCFDCQTTVRRATHYVSAASVPTEARCPSCGKPCDCLGKKIPAPPKSRPKDWQALRESLHRKQHEALAAYAQHRVAAIHVLEQEIDRLAALPDNAGRGQAIKQLRKELEAAHGR